MVKAFAFVYPFFFAFLCCSQTFEAERGGFYFFAPSKSGFVGMSTVALNIGVGEYVSSGNTVTTYYEDGSKMGSSSIDCRDGMTAGFANPENDYSYLVSYFVNTKNSVYKVIIYQADKEADLNRVTINLKSKFSTVLGRGKYVLDLKYAVATDNSFVFVFSKYQENVEIFYLVQVKNSGNTVSIKELEMNVSDKELESGENTLPKFVYDGRRTIYAIQFSKKEEEYFLKIKNVGLKSLKLSDERLVNLEFVNKDLMLCPSGSLENPRAYESGFGSVINRENFKPNSYLKYDISNDNIVATGLYYKNKAFAEKKNRASGIYYATIKKDVNEVPKIDSKMYFSYADIEDPTPEFFSAFGLSKFYWSYLKATDNTIWLSINGVSAERISVKKGGAKQGLIKYLDKKKVIPEKYLKTGKSVLLETLKSFYCLYNTSTNSVGYYTKLTIKEFPK